MKKNISNIELRSIQLDMLQFIHNFCLENGIRYSLARGTLLGAVRHGGYIPWDDDVDIAMLRSDYEKFRMLFSNASDTYRLLDCRDDDDYHLPYGKVHNIQTYVDEGASSTKNTGVFIDVFPVDNLLGTYRERKKIYNLYKFYRLLLYAKLKNLRIMKKWWKVPFVYLLKLLSLPYSAHRLALKMNSYNVSSSKDGAKYVCPLQDLLNNPIFEANMWSTFSKIKFEGREFMCIADSHKYLELTYGDYMQFPPQEQQVPKHSYFEVCWK